MERKRQRLERRRRQKNGKEEAETMKKKQKNGKIETDNGKKNEIMEERRQVETER
jgi:hypothetical protein